MPPEHSAAPPVPTHARAVGPYVLDDGVAVSSAHGTIAATRLDGTRVFARWSDCDGGEACGAEREFRVLVDLASPAVPEALDLLRTPTRCWCITEFVDGAPATSADGLDAGSVARDVLAALRAAHSQGWAHGDLKPSNLVVRADGRVVVVDWELATRLGEPVPPGTLGYAPPEAWDHDYRARSTNDYYALAVIVLELLTGERLFVGPRRDVLARQLSTSLSAVAPAGTSAALVALLSAAGDRLIPSETALQPGSRFDPAALPRLARLLARPLAGTAAEADGTVHCESNLSAVAAELPRAVADHWRLSRSRNVVELDHLFGDGGAHPSGAVSRSDALRELVARRLPELPSLLGSLQPGVLLARVVGGSPAGAIARRELGRLLGEGADPIGGWSIVDVDGRESADGDAASRVGPVREALRRWFVVDHVEPSLLDAVAADSAQTLETAVTRVDQMITDGSVATAGGALVVRSSAAAGTSAALAAGSTIVASSFGSTAQSAELALARGCRMDAYRLAVRATSATLARSPDAATTDQELCRLSDLWRELGKLSAALFVLPPADSQLVLRRRGRLLASTGGTDELRAVGDRLAALPGQRQDPEAERFRALAELRAGDGQAAFRRLRAVLRLARVDPAPAGALDAAATLGNVLVSMRRVHSGGRLLRWVQSRAVAVRDVRLELRVEDSLLRSRSGVTTGAEGARAWARLAARCESWGETHSVPRLRLYAALLYQESDASDAARCELLAAEDAMAASVGVERSLVEMHAAVRAGIWSRGDLLLPAPSSATLECTTPLGARAELAAEFEQTMVYGARQPDLAGRRNGDVRRVPRAIARWALRGGDTRHRLGAALARVPGGLAGRTPIVGAASRWLIGLAPDDWTLLSLLSIAREAASESDPTHEFALALHVHAVIASGIRDLDACRWLRSNAPDAATGRPFGVWTWEWRLALVVAEHVLGVDADADRRAEAALDDFADWVRRNDLDAATAARMLPTVAVCDAVDLARPESSDGAAAQPAAVTMLRAHLRTQAIGFRGSRGRAAGLERVLRSALRLRASGSVDAALQETVSGVLDVCRAERAVAIYEADGVQIAKVATPEGIVDMAPEDAETSASALAQVRLEQRACIFDDACADSGLEAAPSVRRYRPRSLMIAPLEANGRTLGYLYVENRSLPKSFSPSDLQLLEGFTAQVGLALENARLVQELRTSLDELKRIRTEAVRAESLRVLGQMAGEVAHDFNNLLAVVLGETQLLLLQDRSGGETRRSLELVERAALDGAAAIRRIQDSTRPSRRQQMEFLDVGTLVSDVVDYTRVRWTGGSDPSGRGVRVRSEVATGLTVRGLGPELREVFTNLVLNAIDAMPEGGDLTIEVVSLGEQVEICVADTGCGIPEDVAARMFDPFFSTKGDRGNGLGLAIAKEIVERHGGGIAVRSEPACGTRMTVNLPLVVPDRGAVRSRDGAESLRGVGHGRRAMVVDDEPGVLRVLEAMLRADGYDVLVCESGSAACNAIAGGERVDVLVTDLHMPGTSGLDVARTARDYGAAERVVIMTGCGADLDGDGVCPDAVLRKPFMIADVRCAVAPASTLEPDRRCPAQSSEAGSSAPRP